MLEHFYSFEDLTIVTNILTIDSQWAFISSTFSLNQSLSILNRYKVSYDSLSAIAILLIKSFLLTAHWASATFAHILVQLLKSCEATQRGDDARQK